MEPPPCIQNAMLTKDKKPFTYTPGGLNLNEIKSPRMARRIERNAAYEGVGSTPAQQNRPHVASGSLPPSALAAMQPQMHVQVFPTGPPPPPPMNHSRGGVPPPPPPMSNIPPPPPPPTQPLPTQKVRTSDQQIVERPDMTKIIPENPMGLLKKTGGPKIRNTLLEEMYRNPEGAVPQQVSMNRNVAQQHPSSPHPQQVRSPPIQQVRSPPPQQVRSPPIENIPYQQQMQRSVQTPPQQAWSPPIIERKESPRTTNQQPTYPQQPERNVNVGCIYIPPMNPQQNKNVASPPPAPQSPNVRTPGTPTLKDAPKPWQQKQQDKQEEAPQWTIREPSSSTTAVPQEQYIPQSASSQQQNRPRWPQNNQTPPNIQHQRPQDAWSPNPQQMQQGLPEGREVYTQRILQPQFDPTSNPNAVFVSQPIILQHPGAHYGPPIITKREHVQQEGGVRTIPIQIEGRETANDNRNLSRQQSWSSNPSQSGSFRVIQKITGTDGEEDGFNGASEHSARYPQQFPAEQMRKMQLGDTDQQLLNRFKQVPSDDAHNKPQVRNIPIQIEGNGGPKNSNYVPPSQQVPAEEPKKYTGSSIPSRSFRMLQAMTAPDSCANVKEANETNENYDFPYQGNNWGFPPAYPMYNPQPFWPPYYSPVPYKIPSTEHSNSDPELNRASASKTPQPYFGYPPYTPTKELEQKSLSRTPSSFSRCSSSTELENINWRQTPIPYPMYPSPTTPVPGRRTPRKNMTDSEGDSKTCTPVPFWYGYPPPDSQEKLENPPPECNYNYYPPYPPYYDPYYFPYYYYGYPPMFPPLPFVRPGSDPEDLNGYSSMDEMSYYAQRNHDRSTKPSESNPDISNASPESVVTPTPENDPETQFEQSSSESDTDTETNHVEREPPQNSCKIQTIRSVPDINVYKQSDDESELSEVDDESDVSSNSSVYEGEIEEEVVPHQLSVIFEVSEVTDTPRLARESSVFSDCTTIEGMRSDDEDGEDSISKQWISDNLMEIASRIQNRINARIELDDSKLFPSSTAKAQPSKKDIVTNTDGRRNQHQEDSICANIDDDQTELIPHESCIENNDESHNQGSGYEEYDCKETKDVHHKEQEKYEDSYLKCQENVEKRPRSENDCQEELYEEISEPRDEHHSNDKDVEESPSKESSDSEDWWGVIGKNEDDFPKRKTNTYYRDTGNDRADIEPENVVPEEEVSITIDTANIEGNYIQNGMEVINNEIEGDNLPEEEYIPEKETLPKDTYEETYVFYTKEVKQATVTKLEVTSSHFAEEEEEASITIDTANVEEKYEKNNMKVINVEIKRENLPDEKYLPEKETLPKDTYEENDVFYTEEVKRATVPKLEITSAHSSHSSASSRKVSSEQSDDSSESVDSDSSEDEEEDNKHDMNNNVPNDEEETIVIPSIKDRIKALQECITVKKKSHKIEEEIRISVKNQVESIDSGEVNKSKPISAKSSVRSFDEISEEDSGVTDLSKQYSDNEEFPELRKMSKYQRASTHSRLFQLLQEECENEEDQTDLESRKNQLSLPLNSNVSDQLAEELVHSMLKQKKGQIFRNMSVDKLHAAAKKVLQEDGDGCDTPSEGYSDYLSPLRNDTGNSTPQEFYGHYNEYVQYYDSWAQAAALQESEIIQSNTFRMIQDLGQKTNGCPAILAKCPRVLSGKNVHSDLKKLVESPEESSTNIPDPKS